jgi:FAD/FMN-containing dehydrogenase
MSPSSTPGEQAVLEALAALRAAVGESHVHCPAGPDDAAFRSQQTDWRGRYHGWALAIVAPADTEEVAAVVRVCARHGLGIVPQGGHTGLVGGGVPDASGRQIVLSLRRLRRILAVDAANLTLTAQAGCLLAEVQAAAAEAGLLFPLSLAAEGSCTLGGNLATNAGGTQVLRFGNARDLCLGLEAVNAQGEVWHGLSGLRKDNTGYDLRHLLIGSEGTLGLITAATLKLFPAPRSQQAALLACSSLDAALSLLQAARSALDAQLTGFEVMGAYPLALTLRHQASQATVLAALGVEVTAVPGAAFPSAFNAPTLPAWVVLLDAASPLPASALQDLLEGLCAQALDAGWATQAALSQSDMQYQAMWALREAIPLAEKAEALMVKHDIGIPSSRIPRFVDDVATALQASWPGVRIVCFGHMGDGNLHFNVQGPADLSAPEFLQRHQAQVETIVYDLVQACGGSISAEHGVGQLKRQELAQRADPVKLTWMRAIKQALDPQGLFNPGKLL